MIEKWTEEQMNKVNDVDFSIEVLNEKRIELPLLSPLAKRLRDAIAGLKHLREYDIGVRARKYILDAIQQHLDEGYCTNYDMAQDKLEQDPSIAFDYAYDCGRYDTLTEFKQVFMKDKDECEEEISNTRFLRYDFVNDNEVVDIYDSEADLIKVANEFYHDTFSNEEGYKEDFEVKTLNDAIELFEGSGFGIAKILQYGDK